MQLFEGALRLSSKTVVARDTLKLCFVVEGEDHFLFEAGQFVSIQFGEKSWRAYSIASPPWEGELELLVRLIEGGVASEAFGGAEVGDSFHFKGPFGHFGLSDEPDAHLIFCATGTGIAPIRSMILAEERSGKARPMTLFYGGRDDQDIGYLDEIKDWSGALNWRLGFSQASDLEKLGDRAENCRITKFLEDHEFAPQDEFYICGNGDMVKSVVELLENKDVDNGRIFMERFN